MGDRRQERGERRESIWDLGVEADSWGERGESIGLAEAEGAEIWVTLCSSASSVSLSLSLARHSPSRSFSLLLSARSTPLLSR